jgi:hypothetical protein
MTTSMLCRLLRARGASIRAVNMISAADFEDIFGWGPPRARTGLPTEMAAPAAATPILPEAGRRAVARDATALSEPDSEEIFGWCPARARTGLPRVTALPTDVAAEPEPVALDVAAAVLDAATSVLAQVGGTPPSWVVDVVLAERESSVREAQIALEEAQAALEQAKFSRAALTVLRDVLAVTP